MDDRAYTAILAAWHLSTKRQEEFRKKDVPKINYQDYLNQIANSGNNKSPFGGQANPFANRSGFRFH